MTLRVNLAIMLSIVVCASYIVPVYAIPPEVLQNYTGTNSTSLTAGMPNPQITVTTNKPNYNDGDQIIISGTTRDYLAGIPVTVIVRNPIGNVITVDQVNLGSDRTYSTTITARGALWQAAGTYSILAEFGSQDRIATTSFDFAGSEIAPIQKSIAVDGTSFSVMYTITNGQVLDIRSDTEAKSLIISIQTSGDGVLTITLPRSLIDAKINDQDDQFFVLNDGQEVDFQEINKTSTARTLTIPFTDGTEQIEVIGTQIVPEFGPIADLVLAIAIISIIAVSAKTGLRLVPRY